MGAVVDVVVIIINKNYLHVHLLCGNSITEYYRVKQQLVGREI